MSAKSVLKVVDMGLPSGAPGISNMVGGNKSTPTASGQGMSSVPQMGAQPMSTGSPSMMNMMGLRGKG
jgi:hypothetical protein